MRWDIQYHNDTGPDDEGFWEWWTVTDGEAEYSQMANAIWFAKWEKWQREEWERIFR